MDSIQLLSVILKCSAKADAVCWMPDAGCWSRQRPDVFSEEEQWPPLEVFVGGDGSLLDYSPALQRQRRCESTSRWGEELISKLNCDRI